MTLEINEKEKELLRKILESYLSDLREDSKNRRSQMEAYIT